MNCRSTIIGLALVFLGVAFMEPAAADPNCSWTTPVAGLYHVTQWNDGSCGFDGCGCPGGCLSHNRTQTCPAENYRAIDIGISFGPVYADQSGYVYNQTDNPCAQKTIRLVHDDATVSIFGHLSEFWVPNGARVNINDRIGTSGDGNTCVPAHLHWGTKRLFHNPPFSVADPNECSQAYTEALDLRSIYGVPPNGFCGAAGAPDGCKIGPVCSPGQTRIYCGSFGDGCSPVDFCCGSCGYRYQVCNSDGWSWGFPSDRIFAC